MEFDPFKVNAYSIEELAAFVKSGSLTLQDIYMSGLHYSKHAELEAFLAKDDIEKKKEARDMFIASNEDTIEDHEIVAVKKELLADMKENSWRYRQVDLDCLFKGVDLSNEDIRHYLEDEDTPKARFLLTGGRLTMEDLYEAEVVPVNIKKSDLLAVDFRMPATEIKEMGDYPKDRTDAYFVGVSLSGKSSVLAAIMYNQFREGCAGYESQLVNGEDPCLSYYYGLIRAISMKKVPYGNYQNTISYLKINILGNNHKTKSKVNFVEIFSQI